VKQETDAVQWPIISSSAFTTGIKTRIGNHTFRATGITQYLRNDGRRELAQQMTAHESPRTTALYDRRGTLRMAVDEVERISSTEGTSYTAFAALNL
jgi:integrase